MKKGVQQVGGKYFFFSNTEVHLNPEINNYGAALPTCPPPPITNLFTVLIHHFYPCREYQIEYVSFHVTVINIILETLEDEKKFHRTQFLTTRGL